MSTGQNAQEPCPVRFYDEDTAFSVPCVGLKGHYPNSNHWFVLEWDDTGEAVSSDFIAESKNDS